MAYSVSFEPESIDDLDKISEVVRVRILKKIQWLSVNFEKISALPLTGQWSRFYKVRVGDYRVIYEFDIENQLIFIAMVGHRREIY